MKVALITLLLCSFAVAKDRAWQDGTPLRAATENGGAAVVPLNGMLVGVPITHLTYVFEVSDLLIAANTNKPLDITFGKKTRVAIDGKHLFVIDDSGKEKKLFIVGKRLKEKPQEPK